MSAREQSGIPFLDLKNRAAVAPVMDFPREIALEYGVLPIQDKPGSTMLLAFPKSRGLDLLDEVRFSLSLPFQPVLADDGLIEEQLRRLYGGREVSRAEPGITRAVGSLADAGGDAAGQDATSVFKRLLEEAIRARASDIHIEPLNERLRVRFRIDGVLHDVDSMPLALQGPIISHVKVAAVLDITEKRLPQDGRIEFRRDVDLRVSVLPTNHGESVVIRILERGLAAYKIDEIGLMPEDRKLLDKLLNVQDGFVVVTGPTGSGKTTSLYAFLKSIANPSVKIITVEDPVEYITEGFTQIPVDTEHGTDFGTALRAILRHDPDIVLLGEIRDQDSARTALQSALTGHQVFSTLHTNDAASAIGRLVNLGAEPYLVNAALTAVIAQRLVRKICPQCKETYPATDSEKRRIEREGVKAPDQLYRGKGCAQCYKTGYRGRFGVYEIITINNEIQKLILSNSPAGRIRDAAKAAGMRGIRTDGMSKAVAGLTTVEEVVRVLY